MTKTSTKTRRKVWLATGTDHDDNFICVFSTERKARAWKTEVEDERGGYEFVTIEERNLN
jgi:hypothetical protein